MCHITMGTSRLQQLGSSLRIFDLMPNERKRRSHKFPCGLYGEILEIFTLNFSRREVTSVATNSHPLSKVTLAPEALLANKSSRIACATSFEHFDLRGLQTTNLENWSTAANRYRYPSVSHDPKSVKSIKIRRHG